MRLSKLNLHSPYFLYGLVAIIILCIGVLHDSLLGTPTYSYDDPYIFLHNAQVLHWGHDPNYRGVPALAGTTSPIYLLLVALLLFVVPGV